ncbi:hypothetical protein [Abditibacterium utsteinense]|uniref:hypothetical protein n=1 Tax=Abditibacterium utsteinense TaxID=1960156 RepID=UPI0013008817|nr:hypothetical protein [Abditibacterium utsteinense]
MLGAFFSALAPPGRAAAETIAGSEVAAQSTKNQEVTITAAKETAAATQSPKKRKKSSTLPVAEPVAEPMRLESLDVRASKAIYAGGEPVFLNVSLVNKSAKPVSFLMLGPNIEFKLKREGKIVGLTRKGQQDSKGDKVSFRSAAVGGRTGYTVVLNRLFDLSRPGNYVVSCTKYLKNDNRESGAGLVAGSSGEMVGPRIVSPDVKFSVADSDIETQNR